ncbi:MAG: PH domain-containing protein [Bacilli bacterium]
MGNVYRLAKEFKRKYPFTVAWRLRQNSKIIEKHLNPDEEVTYVFVGQKALPFYSVFNSCVIAVTNKRLLIGRNRVVVGYFLDAVTPDLFNDFKVKSGVIWGKIYIDTVKEFIVVSHLDKSSLEEIETKVTTFMMREKKKYGSTAHKSN